MRTGLRWSVPALGCLGGLALAQDAKYNFDPTVNFSNFTT